MDDAAASALADDLVIDNVYLPYDSKTARKHQIEGLANRPNSPRLVLGDFNMAPRPQDGRFGAGESNWTGVGERRAFDALLLTGLVDLGASDPPEFTFERLNQGCWSRFRCDLALASTGLGDGVTLTVDSGTRSPTGFTDHSALIVDL